MIHSTQIKPMPGKILVKKLPDETTTKSGIILPIDQPLNQQYDFIEVVKVGKNIEDRPDCTIVVKPGDRCLVMGKGIYDTVRCEDGIYFIVNQSDIFVTLE